MKIKLKKYKKKKNQRKKKISLSCQVPYLHGPVLLFYVSFCFGLFSSYVFCQLDRNSVCSLPKRRIEYCMHLCIFNHHSTFCDSLHFLNLSIIC
uniref:Uncharacterized protein n=1 Tax=Pyxicephalus adspersus TaxID=30357 RepID=A0AAV3A4I3_PYXAD|nr:TPA: hypothetical protein GDO54_018149 [Pyxicephalus adspersus]